MNGSHDHSDSQAKEEGAGSIGLWGGVAMGTGVMIGAGIFALTGQLAEHAGGLFPLAFLAAAIVCGFSAYSYVMVCRVAPSAGGIAMILKKCYGPGVVTAGCSLLMYFSYFVLFGTRVINFSLNVMSITSTKNFFHFIFTKCFHKS